MAGARIPFAAIAVLGLGLFVAASVGVTLYVSGAAGVRSTQTLLAEQAETLIDSIEHRVHMLLRPVESQAGWVHQSLLAGDIDLEDDVRLDAFMSGALGATPQVAGIGIVAPDAKLRRWSREWSGETREDLAGRPGVPDWLQGGRERQTPSWRPPLWAQARNAAMLLHDTPLHLDGRYLGMLTQLVPVAALSDDLAELPVEQGITPFILYGGRVLAHSHLARRATLETSGNPLPAVADIGDPVLERFGSPDVQKPFGMRKLARAQASSARVGGEQFLFIYREVGRYGPEPWIIGAHIDVKAAGYAAEMWRVVQALIAGGGVLVLAVLVAALVGRRMGRPIEALARAAKVVDEENLDEVPVLEGSVIAEFDDAARSFNRMVEGLRERSLIRRTLGRFVSKQVARRLLKAGGRIEPVEAEATVLFCDLEGFTPLTESLGPVGVVAFLNDYFGVIVEIVERHGGLMTQYQGDAVLAVFNVPVELPGHAQAALRAGIEMARATETRQFAGVSVRNRVGIATGPLVAGSIGARGRLTYTVHGNVVNLASRLEALNKDFGTRVLVDAETARRCPDIGLRRVAEVAVRGYGAPVALYTVDAGGAGRDLPDREDRPSLSP
jgi:class 3 adenylate cyclase